MSVERGHFTRYNVEFKGNVTIIFTRQLFKLNFGMENVF